MLALKIVATLVLLVGTILTVVITTIVRFARRRMARELAVLESEGIERDSGVVGGTIRYVDFHAPGFYSGMGGSGTRRRLVLTARQLAILGGTVRFHIPRGELGRWQISAADGRLRIASDQPHGATGHVELRLAVAEPERWVAILRDAGAAAAAPAGTS